MTLAGSASARPQPVRPENQQAVELETLSVEGTGVEGTGGERPNGPVVGYVAQRSATATKTNTAIIDTPQSITVIPRQQIEDQAAQTVQEALRYTAGVISESRPSAGRYDSVQLRGFGGAGSNASYVNYLDGLKLLRGTAYAVPAIDPYGLERIEVLRGPSAVLFGQVNPGGLVNLVSKLPLSVPFHEVQFVAGRYGRVQGAFDLTGPIDPEGKFLYRVTGLGRSADTQVDDTREERIYIAPAFTWRPDAATTLTVLAKFQRDPETGFYGFTPMRGTRYPTRYGNIPTNFFPGGPAFEGYSRNETSVGYQFEHRFDDAIAVRSSFRYMDLDSKFQTLSVAAIGADDRTLTRRGVQSLEHLKAISFDNQAQFDFTTGLLQHRVLVGTDYQRGYSTANVAVGSAPSIDWLSPVYGRTPSLFAPTLTDQLQEQIGLYAQDQIRFDRLIVLGSLRRDWSTLDQTLRLTGANTVQRDGAVTGRAALMYQFDGGFAPYASYATSFEPQVGNLVGGALPQPSAGEQYEIGLKYQPPGTNALFTFSAYDLTQTNVLSGVPNSGGLYRQIGEVHAQGIELEARASLFTGFDVIAAFALTDPIVTKSAGTDVGKRPILQPNQSGSLWAHYTVPTGPLAGFGLGGGVRFVGNTLGDPSGVFKVPSYTLVDAVLSYDFAASWPELKGWRAAVNAQNLFDTTYVAACYNVNGSCVYGLRRTVLGSLTYRW